MNEWLAEWPDALNLIAERRGIDLHTAAGEYVRAAWDGDITVRELKFGPPYGIDRGPIPRARWGAAAIAEAQETDEGKRYGWFHMQSPAVLEWGPIHWQGFQAISEAGMRREVRREDLDRVWPPSPVNLSAGAAAGGPSQDRMGVVARRHQGIASAGLELIAEGKSLDSITAKERSTAICDKIGVKYDARGYGHEAITRALKTAGLIKN
jgi:hypothetical protein